MPAYATRGDVAVRLMRPLSEVEAPLADMLVEDASRMIRRRVAGIDTRAATNTDLAADARATCANMVKRVLQNPEGFRVEGIDDSRQERDAVLSAGLLDLLPSEMAALAPVVPGLSGGPYVVSLGG